MVRGLLDILFPPACVGCGRVLPVETFFCEGCDGQLERLPRTVCRLCAEPGDFDHATCPRCEVRPPPFAAAFAPFAHEGPLARAIHRFKYEDHPELAPTLAALLRAEAPGFLARPFTAVCALPLHPSRLRERRYDQAELLAGELARLLGLPRLVLLHRVRPTKRQVGLSESERERNVRGAFEAGAGAQGQDLLLVDDVFTTGATARAAASALLEQGARKVEVVTLARAFTL
jgi:ComF family protein